MAADVEPDLKLEIAHILTIDVVAYSTLLIHEQSRVMADLNRIVRNTPRFRGAEAEGKLTRLPTGDGMALVFHGDPEAPVECAMQISAELRTHREIRLRMGIHSGPINQILDVNDRSNVAGAGIDMAQRVMDCGDAGHILVSKRVADDLAPHLRWNRHLHDLGECEVKHGRRIGIFNLFTDTLGNPILPRKLQPAAGGNGTKWRKQKFLILAPIGAGVAVGLAFFFWPVRPSLAVLPFRDGSQNRDQEYFSDGMTEEISKSLGNTPGLRVIGRSSAFSFKGRSEDARKAGRQLGVTHVVEGSVKREAGRVRMNAVLIVVRTGYEVWMKEFDVTEQDALTLAKAVAVEVARALRIGSQTRLGGINAMPASDPEANDLYFRGRFLLNKRTISALQEARELFERALARNPEFAAAYCGLADAYILLAEYGAIGSAEGGKLASPNVSKALELDPNLAEAHVSRAMLLGDFDWDWETAKGEFEHAIGLNPNNVPARHWYGLHLAELARFEDALDQIAAARERDPLAPIVRAARAKILLVARRYDEAIEQCRDALELQPNFLPALEVMGQVYACQGKFPEAMDVLKKCGELASDDDMSLERAYIHGCAGQRQEAEQILQKATSLPEAVSAYDLATVYSALRDEAEALRWLEVAISRRSLSLVWFRVDPRLDNIRATPRFTQLTERISKPSPPR